MIELPVHPVEDLTKIESAREMCRLIEYSSPKTSTLRNIEQIKRKEGYDN